MSCADCRYFDGSQCRIAPPIVIVGAGSMVFTVFPQVLATDWCGEFKGTDTYVAAQVAAAQAAAQAAHDAPAFEPMVEL